MRRPKIGDEVIVIGTVMKSVKPARLVGETKHLFRLHTDEGEVKVEKQSHAIIRHTPEALQNLRDAIDKTILAQGAWERLLDLYLN